MSRGQRSKGENERPRIARVSLRPCASLSLLSLLPLASLQIVLCDTLGRRRERYALRDEKEQRRFDSVAFFNRIREFLRNVAQSAFFFIPPFTSFSSVYRRLSLSQMSSPFEMSDRCAFLTISSRSKDSVSPVA